MEFAASEKIYFDLKILSGENSRERVSRRRFGSVSVDRLDFNTEFEEDTKFASMLNWSAWTFEFR